MLIPVDAEVEHIRYIFETYAQTGVSLRRVMDGLLENGMAAASGSWSTAKLSSIIRIQSMSELTTVFMNILLVVTAVL